MTLTEFLRARIAEDEAVRDAGCDSTGVPRSESDNWGWVRRSKAECEAKRRIVELHDGQGIGSCAACFYDDYESGLLPADWPCSTIKALAAVYADHPDCREEWKP